jgi:hypothetical protein
MAWAFLARLQLALARFSWPMIECHSQLSYSILSRMNLFDMYEANFDKLRVIMDIIIPAQAHLQSDQ